jgi:phosphoserine phosphatase RsbU/P
MSIRPDPPIGTADDPERRSTAAVIPPGALLSFFTDGLVERRDQAIDLGIGRVAATLDEILAADEARGGGTVPLAEQACAAVMRALVGNASAQDDIAMLMLHRH